MQRLYLLIIFNLLFWFCSSNFIVTEIFVDWTQEYIELQNIWIQSYSWVIQIEWVKSSSVIIETNQEIQPNEYLVIWDSLIQIEEKKCHVFEDYKLSLTDSKWVNGILYRWSWSYIFSIEKDTIVSIDNQKRSLVLQDWSYLPIIDTQSINVTEWYIWSPCDQIHQDMPEEEQGTPFSTWVTIWSWMTLTWWMQTWDTVNQWIISTWSDTSNIDTNEQEEEVSWWWDSIPPDTVSSVNTDTISQNQCASNFSLSHWSITIYAVSPRNWLFSDEFLMVESSVYFSGSIHLVWWWRSSNTNTYSVVLNPWIPLVIASSSIWFTDKYPIYIDSALSLTDSWELLSIQQLDWTVLDEVTWDSSSRDIMLFWNTQYEWQPRALEREWSDSLLFSSLQWLSCDFKTDGLTVSLSTSNLCNIPWDEERYDTQNTRISWVWCEWWVSLLTWWMLSFEKKIWNTTICSNTIYLELPQSSESIWEQDIDSSTSITTSWSLLTGWSIKIIEISPKEWIFAEYVEIEVWKWITGEVEIVWLWQWNSSKTVSITSSLKSYVITDRYIESIPLENQIVIGSISLTDDWETLQVRQWWQVIDTVSYSWLIQNSSSRNRNESDLFILSSQTPWFNLKMIKHLLPIPWKQVFNCAIRTQNKSAFTNTKKLNLVASIDWKDVTNASSKYSCEWIFSDLIYSSDYKEESRCNPGYLSFPESGVFEVKLVMNDTIWNICTTTTQINAPEIISQSLSSSPWKSWYYQWLYQKRKLRFQDLKSNIKPYWLTTNASWSIVSKIYSTTLNENWNTISWEEGIIEIIKVLPNPSWADKENEKIVLRNTSEIEFSTEWRSLDTWKSTKKLPKVILPVWEETLVVWSLWLVNSNRCISLISPEKVHYDEFCYGVAKDDQRFAKSNAALKSFLSENSVIHPNDLKISFTDIQSCLLYEWNTLQCKDLPVDKETLTALKSNAKKTLSIQKKYDTEIKRRKKYQTQLAEQKTKTTSLRKDYQKKLKKEKTKSSKYYNQIKDQKRLWTIYRGLIAMRKDLLQSEYEPLYTWSWFENAWIAYRQSLDLFYTEKPIEYWPISIPITEIDTLAAYLWWYPNESNAKNTPSQLIDQLLSSLLLAK